MRILIMGAGGVGGFLGARLLEAGADVTFLVREGRSKQLAENGLVLKSGLGDFSGPVKAITLKAVEPEYDLIVLAIKAYHMDDGVMADLTRTRREGSYIVPLLNGLRHMDQLDAAFGRENVFGGLCRLAMTQEPDGTLRHLGGGEHYVFGKRGQGGDAVLDTVSGLLENAAINFQISGDISQAMWEKFFPLATLAGATCLMRAPVGCIASAMDGKSFMSDLYSEAAAVSRAAGHTSSPAHYDAFLEMLIDQGSPLTASLLRDLEAGNPIEADHLIGDFYRRGRAAGLPMPLFKLVWIHLQAALERRDRES